MMESPPLITVIIAVYNSARYLAEAINSVLRQTYKPLELVLVDDGSEDGSADVARSFAPSLQYVYQPHEGMGSARNRGVALAQGVLLAFLDADDLFPSDRLERQMAAFLREPTLEAVFGHVREFLSPDLDEVSAKRLRRHAERIPGRLPGAMLIKKDAFHRVGPFNTTLKVGIGMDWSARASEQRLKSLMLQEIVMERRLHNENNGLRQREWHAQYVQVLKAALDRRRAMRPR
jgi:glycosyltransferase involved in cell wall biosynthesis